MGINPPVLDELVEVEILGLVIRHSCHMYATHFRHAHHMMQHKRCHHILVTYTTLQTCTPHISHTINLKYAHNIDHVTYTLNTTYTQ